MNNFIADPQLYADLTYFTLFIISFIACYEWFKNTPNTRARIKCLILFEMLYLITNILAFPVYYLNIAFVMEWIRAIALSFWIGYIIFRNGQATPSRLNDKETISKIEQLVGTRWNIINNCFTRIRPLLKEKNKNGKN